MPIYEYACTDCAHKLDVLQKMNDLPLKQCPACGENSLKKLVSAPAFHLKGSGWYETDFSGKKKNEDKEQTGKTDKTKKTDKTENAKKTEKTETPPSAPAEKKGASYADKK